MTRSRDNATNVAGDISGVTAGTGLSGGGTEGALTLNLSTPVAATNGGTGLSTFTTGDIPYASASNTLAKLAIGSTDQVLKVSGGIPAWAAATSISILGQKTITAGTNYSTTSTTLTAVNTTNFRVAITTGSNTTIVVFLNGRAQITGGGVNIWSVSLGAGTTYEMVASDSTYIGVNEGATMHIITGLSANTAYNVDWMFRTSNAAQAAQIIGDSTNAYPRMLVLG